MFPHFKLCCILFVICLIIYMLFWVLYLSIIVYICHARDMLAFGFDESRLAGELTTLAGRDTSWDSQLVDVAFWSSDILIPSRNKRQSTRILMDNFFHSSLYLLLIFILIISIKIYFLYYHIFYRCSLFLSFRYKYYI